MKIGIVTYTSLHCNFTNYGTILQSWAMQQALRKINDVNPILVNYCPVSMKDKDPLDPMKNMWDKNGEARKLCEMSLPAIRENYKKICDFYHQNMVMTRYEYDVDNFDNIHKEGITNFLIGSDSIFDIQEFGLDRVYFADTNLMRGRSIAYAPSFQDSIDNYRKEDLSILNQYLRNFNRLSLRENQLIPYVKENVRGDVQQVIDPTLLLHPDEYESIIAESQMKEKYLLYYSRRYNPEMEKFVYDLALKTGLKVVEISLRANNAEKAIMRYDAGVEEFLSLVKNAEYVVTNSYHCMIFAVQFSRPFFVFSREHCERKIVELLQMLGLYDRYCTTAAISRVPEIDYSKVCSMISDKRKLSFDFLNKAVESLK